MTSAKGICRLCLDTIHSDFDALNACKVEMLKIISLDLDLGLSENPLVCAQCATTLQQSFDFKMAFLNNEDYLKTFVHCDSSVKLNLEEIIQRNAVGDVKSEEVSVCRLCLRYLDIDSFVELDSVEEDIFLLDMLQKCVPELDLGVSSRPLMCYECMEKLQNQFNFVTACVDNNDKIKSYVEANVTNNNDTIDLSDVLKYAKEDKGVGAHYLNYVKVETVIENSNDADGDVIKQEAMLGNVFGDNVGSEADPISSSVPNPVSAKSYSCKECGHTTNRKDSLAIHSLVHRSLPKSELVKCEKCDFKTKWKSSLTKHLLLHVEPSDVVTYKCARCPYESKYKNHLRRHCKRHVDSELYRCQHCWLTTTDRAYFKLHNKTKHDEAVKFPEERFECSECRFATPYKSELDSHRKEAHNIAKYVCECGYSSQRLYHFEQHSLRHKGSDEVASFDCDVCDFQTKYKKSLKSHVALHKAGKVPRKRRAKRTKKSSL